MRQTISAQITLPIQPIQGKMLDISINHVTVKLKGGADQSKSPDPVMTRFAALYPELAKEINDIMQEFLQSEKLLFQFIHENSSNGQKYLADPIGTLVSVCGIQPETAARLEKLSGRLMELSLQDTTKGGAL